MVKYVNNQTVAVKVVEKKTLAETTVQPGESIDLQAETDEISTEDVTP